ncbi:MAG: HD domain-containing phosphohydrolase [Candidatus Omnitrophota bacterium]
MKKTVPLNKIAEDILREKNVETLLEKFVDRIKSILNAERATFYFFNEDSGELWSYAASELEIKEIRVPLARGIAGKAASEKKLLNIKDAYKCAFFDKQIDKKTGFRTRSVLCAPILGRDSRLLGVLQVLNKRVGCFTKGDEGAFRSLCFYISVALENMRLLQENETLFRSTLYALAGAIDAKDPTTAGHSHRVAYLSVRIARELGCSSEEIKIIEYAAYLHDVGKIGIPDRILRKRQRLTTPEYRLIRKHPLYTLRILKNIIFSRESRLIPLIASQHHEFLDGSGYPFNLKKKQINILARIITVADIYDALVSFDRPYKKHLSTAEALKILKQEVKAGHLDKSIVSAFVKNELYKHERRRYKRLDLKISISYQIILQKRIFKERIKAEDKATPYDLDILEFNRVESSNISAGGLLFLTRQYLPVGTYLDLEIEIASARIKCIGKVVWAERMVGTPSYRVGVSFINFTASRRKMLSRQLSRLYPEKY